MTARVLILGGGFGGVYTALGLDADSDLDADVTLISRDNFFLFTPMLTEVATSSIDTRHIVNPIRRMFRRTHFVEGEITRVDLEGRAVSVTLPSGHPRDFTYDHLVIALGSVINDFGLPGVASHTLPLKTLADAIRIRNHVIQQMEIADVLPPHERTPHLTFVVAGGNLAGIELTGDVNDFVRDAAPAYRNLKPSDFRVILVEAGPRLIRDLSERLAAFAMKKLQQRGVEVHVNAAVQEARPAEVEIQGVGTIPTHTVIWTAGVSPTPFVRELDLPLQKGRLQTDNCMRVQGRENVWALGDVAAVPNNRGGYHPPTAQHAIREGGHLAGNIARAVRAEVPEPFDFQTIGMLSTVGHRSGVGEIMGIRVSGFLAWWMWRSYYLFRLPRMEKRVRVLIDWTLDLVFPRDIVQLKMGESSPEKELPN